MADFSALGLDEINSGLFSPLIGSDLILEGEAGDSLTVTVTKVVEAPHATPRDAKRIGFSAILTAPLPCDSVGGRYVVTHPSLGRIGPVMVARIHSGEITPSAALFQLVFN